MTLNLRTAVRALLLDEHDRVLLVRFVFPAATVWALPGGGVEEGEDAITALRRELREELGLLDAEIGPHIWNREHVIPMFTGHDGQRDRVHLVRVPRFEPAPTIGWERMRAEFVHEIRWWDRAELRGAVDTWFAPRRLAALVDELVDVGVPTSPVDVGV